MKSATDETARDRVIAALRANPGGLSRSELQRVAACNRGAFRRLVASLVDTGVVVVTDERRDYGGGISPTRVHHLREQVVAEDKVNPGATPFRMPEGDGDG